MQGHGKDRCAKRVTSRQKIVLQVAVFPKQTRCPALARIVAKDMRVCSATNVSSRTAIVKMVEK